MKRLILLIFLLFSYTNVAASEVPSFIGKTINMDINSTLILEDENDAISNYKVYNRLKCAARIEGNQLIIDSYGFGGNGFITLANKITNRQSDIYLRLASQNIVVVNLDSHYRGYSTYQAKAFLGTEYEIINEDNVVVDTIAIDSTYKATSKKFYPGNYCVRQTKITPGYYLNNEIKCTTMEMASGTKTINFTNDAILKEFIISKIFDDTVDQNVEFEISDAINTQKLFTNNLGKGSIFLKYGTYQIVQKSTNHEEEMYTNQLIVNDLSPDQFELIINNKVEEVVPEVVNEEVDLLEENEVLEIKNIVEEDIKLIENPYTNDSILLYLLIANVFFNVICFYFSVKFCF